MTPGYSGPGSTGNKGALHTLEQEPDYLMQFSVIPSTCLFKMRHYTSAEEEVRVFQTLLTRQSCMMRECQRKLI